MWSEELDKNAQEAANNHNPAYDEKNWDQMEALLDKHLPQDKKKRRFIFWWLLPLMVGVTALLFITIKSNTPGSDTKDIQKTSELNTAANNIEEKNKSSLTNSTFELRDNTRLSDQTPTNGPTNDNFKEPEITATQPGTNIAAIKQAPSVRTKNFDEKLAGQTIIPNKTQLKKSSNRNPKDRYNNDLVSSGISANTVISNNTTTPAAISTEPVNTLPANTEQEKQEISVTNAEATDSAKQATDIKTDDIAGTPTTIKKPGRTRDKGFFAGISLGPDISGLGMEKAGSWKMQYGLSAGYAFSKRISVRTGFFVGRKIYTAAPNEYHPPYDLATYYPRMIKIDANCLVYEIPLTVVYNFSQVKRHNWFVSAGASSYLMKDETYDYYYKNSAGNTEMRSRNFSDENNHFFSVINLSGGYNYRFNDRFFLMAEPYLKLPVSGIGYGNVKLNSAGALFTVGMKF